MNANMHSMPLAIALSLLGLQAVTASASEAPPSAADTRPNIVLVITDDQGYGQLGRHGHTWLRTPHMDHLHDESLRFDRFLVSPTCAPTRAALMTGRHPMRNGVTHTIFERERLTLDATTLPEVLAGAGYSTGIFGKWHLGDEEPYQPQNRGFDEAFIHGAGGIGQAYDGSCADAPDNKYVDPLVRHNGVFVKTTGFCTDVFFTAAIDWMRGRVRTGAPFFAYIATNAPHEPFIAPETNTQRFRSLGMEEDHAGFYGMIENIDENLGRLIDELNRLGIAEDTMLIFMSDNGTVYNGAGAAGTAIGKNAQGETLAAYNADMRGYKGSVEEGGVRVPFFVRWPGHASAGVTVDKVVSHIDLFPTLAEIAGADSPEDQVEGRSMAPIIRGDPIEWPDRYLFNHVGRWPTGSDPDDHQWRGFAVRGPRFRLVEGNRLYDMSVDPEQALNVAEQHPEAVARMKLAYNAWWEKTRPLMVNEAAPLSPTKPFHEAYRAQIATGGVQPWQPRFDTNPEATPK